MSLAPAPPSFPMSLLQLLRPFELDDAFDSRLSSPCAHENDKAHVNGVLQLHFWLADCKPPATSSWLTFVNRLKMTSEKGELSSLAQFTRRMVAGDFWRKQLTSWQEIVACLLAALHLCTDDKHLCAARRVLKEKEAENDRMRYAMWKRDFREGEHEPLLEDMPRRDVCDEARWELIYDWLEAGYTSSMWMLLDTLNGCVVNESAPGDALAQLKQLGIPPGFKSSAEQKEAERLQRAMDAEKDDDFDIGEVVDEVSETQSETPLPVGKTPEAVTKCGGSPCTSRKRPRVPEPAGEAILQLKLKIEKLNNKKKDYQLEILKLGGALSSSDNEDED